MQQAATHVDFTGGWLGTGDSNWGNHKGEESQRQEVKNKAAFQTAYFR